MTFTKLITGTSLALALGAGSVQAGPISLADFEDNATILEDFSSLSRAPARGPFNLGDLSFSEIPGGTGVAGWGLFDAKTLTNRSGITNITIDFGTFYNRVGLDVGFFPPGKEVSYRVTFYDAALALLGETEITGTLSNFFGWEDPRGIGRINVLETSGDNGIVGGIDNIRFSLAELESETEEGNGSGSGGNGSAGNAPVPVSEPSSLWLLGLGLLGLLRSRKR